MTWRRPSNRALAQGRQPPFLPRLSHPQPRFGLCPGGINHGVRTPPPFGHTDDDRGDVAVTVAENVLHRLEPLKGSVIPSDVQLDLTRNYGDTAADKSNELLFHMLIAVVSVSILVAITLGLRESLIVFIAIPVTLALTLFVFYLYGYTLNRITLFALIFSIGILVDDAIVVVENIVRHARLAPAGEAMAAIAREELAGWLG